MKRVDGELVLTPHVVDKLELDGLGPVVAQGDEAPPVRVVDLNHLGDIGLLQGAAGHPLAAHALGKKLHQRVQHRSLHPLVRFPCQFSKESDLKHKFSWLRSMFESGVVLGEMLFLTSAKKLDELY